ncbi:MAG: AI-2E family transporter, partial [Gammaproteobacteria bacterium]|nr:AI-2E family transporter [Gammaproteobacteria bacterium]
MSNSGKWMVLAAIVGVGILIYLLSPVLTPFLIAAVLAYIGDPLVDRLEAVKVPRTAAVALVFTGLTLSVLIALIILVPMIERQLTTFAQKLPLYLDKVQTNFIPWLSQKLGLVDSGFNVETIKQSIQSYWQSAGGFASKMMASVTRSGLVLAGWLANLVLIPVVTFYLLRDWDHIVARVNELVPRQSQPIVARLAKESDEVLGAFLRGQMLVMIALATIYAVGLSIIGLDLGILIGLLAGIISFVPYLGFIVGIVLAGLAAIMQFGDASNLIYVIIVFGIG